MAKPKLSRKTTENKTLSVERCTEVPLALGLISKNFPYQEQGLGQ
jgi:hypothetical protein